SALLPRRCAKYTLHCRCMPAERILEWRNRMSRLHEQDADAKQRILHAAKRLFATQGFDGTTVRQICEEASANVALVSYYFGGKEKVFEEVLRTFVPVGRVDELEDALR